MRFKMVAIDLELSRRQRLLVWGGLAAVLCAVGVGAARGTPKIFEAGKTIKASEMNANFKELHDRLTAVEVEPVLFDWTPLTVSTSGVAQAPLEGEETVVFGEPGTYRITLNAQIIYDIPGSAGLDWLLGGTATRLDPFDMEGGSKIHLPVPANVSRHISSTVIYVSATSGQTLTINPMLVVTFSGGTFHQGHFGYAVERVGSAQP